MMTMTAREFNQRTSAALRRVLETGEPMTITYHGRPRVTVAPTRHPGTWVDELVAQGQATPGDRSIPLPDAPIPLGARSGLSIDGLLDAVRADRS